MLTKITYIGSVFLLIVYFIFIIIFINPNLNSGECNKVTVNIIKNGAISYLNESQVYSLLNKAKLNPVGKKIWMINTEAIEKTLKKYGLIKKVEAYKTIGCAVKIKIYQRIPILRIISDHTNDYYIGSDQKIIPISTNFVAYIPLASGAIDKKFALKQLYPLAVFLQKNEFWNAQIEQIYVNNDLEIELIPLIGNHRIVLGEIENFEKKLDDLKFFYEKVLNTIGWKRYSIINLRYKNQIICTTAN